MSQLCFSYLFFYTKDSGRLLTFIDALSINSDLHDLDKYILIALLQSKINKNFN